MFSDRRGSSDYVLGQQRIIGDELNYIQIRVRTNSISLIRFAIQPARRIELVWAHTPPRSKSVMMGKWFNEANHASRTAIPLVRCNCQSHNLALPDKDVTYTLALRGGNTLPKRNSCIFQRKAFRLGYGWI